MVFGVIVFSGCSQTVAEVKAPAETKEVVAEANATVVEKVVEKAVSTVGGGAMHIPFSEMEK